MLTAAAGLGAGGLALLLMGVLAPPPPYDRSSVREYKTWWLNPPGSNAAAGASWQRKRLVVLGIAMIVTSLVLVALDRVLR